MVRVIKDKMIMKIVNPKGNENCFELAGGSGYRGFELPRVKLQLMYDGNPGEINFGLSKREV